MIFVLDDKDSEGSLTPSGDLTGPRVEAIEGEEVRAKKSRPCSSEEEHTQSKKQKPSVSEELSISKKSTYWDGNKLCSVDDLILAKKSSNNERCVVQQFKKPSVVLFQHCPFCMSFL